MAESRSRLWANLDTADKVDLSIGELDRFEELLESFEARVDVKLSNVRKLQWAQLSATGLFLLGLIANLVVLLAGAYGR